MPFITKPGSSAQAAKLTLADLPSAAAWPASSVQSMTAMTHAARNIEIKARIEAASGKEIPKVTFEVGEEVKITDGAFANLTGRVDEVDPARGKLKISVSIFGRFTPVELEYWQVQRASES